MKKINRLATMMCLLFALGACGGNDAPIEEEEEGENSGYVGPHKKDNDEQEQQPVDNTPRINPIFETESGKAFTKLCSLANEQLIASKSLTAGTEYISGLVSLEYASDKVTFCAIGDKQDNTNYLVRVTMTYAFANADDFISKMVNLDVKNASTYSVTNEVMNIYGEPQVNNKFHELKSSKFPKFDDSKVNSQRCYKADSGDTVYFAFTYIGNDSKVHSINEMVLDVANSNITVTSEYEVAQADSQNMCKLFDIILENYD